MQGLQILEVLVLGNEDEIMPPGMLPQHQVVRLLQTQPRDLTRTGESLL